MHTIEQIEARLSAINNELATATGEALTALETEANGLIEERRQLQEEAQRRQAMRQSIAATAPRAAAATATAEPTEEARVAQEEAEFRSFVLGRAATPQNWSVGNNGAIIPTSIARRVIEKVVEICPILQGADVYYVNGNLQIPVYGKAKDSESNDHDITVGYATEFQELTADAGAFTSINLGGYLIGALTLVGRSLQNNATFDVVSFVINKMAEKIAVFVEKELLVGTEGKCTGALSTSNTVKAGSTSAISTDSLIDLQTAIPQAYQANACFTMNPKTWAMVKKLKYNDGRYVVSEDFTQGFPYRLLGKPVYLSDNMPTVASAAKAVLYGDYNGLAVNIHENVSVEVLNEKYATQHAVGVVAWMEMDSKVQDAQKLATLVMSV